MLVYLESIYIRIEYQGHGGQRQGLLSTIWALAEVCTLRSSFLVRDLFIYFPLE